MKRILIALLLGITLVSCGAKREVNSIKNSEWSNKHFFYSENDYNKEEVISLVKKDIEKVDSMYDGYASVIKTDNYIIVYIVEDINNNDYEISVVDLYHGEKDYIEYCYPNVKNAFDGSFGKNVD